MKPMSRRTILRGASGAAIALPWLEAMLPHRARAGTSPKRFIVMFSAERHPADRVDADRQRDQLHAVADPRAAGGSPGRSGDRPGPLPAGGRRRRSPERHRRHADRHAAQPGAVRRRGRAAGRAGPTGPSVDQRIADALAVPTPFRSLELGVQVGAADNWGRMIYRRRNQPLPPEDDPAQVYANVFADLHTDPARAGAAARPPQVDPRRGRRRVHADRGPARQRRQAAPRRPPHGRARDRDAPHDRSRP